MSCGRRKTICRQPNEHGVLTSLLLRLMFWPARQRHQVRRLKKWPSLAKRRACAVKKPRDATLLFVLRSAPPKMRSERLRIYGLRLSARHGHANWRKGIWARRLNNCASSAVRWLACVTKFRLSDLKETTLAYVWPE